MQSLYPDLRARVVAGAAEVRTEHPARRARRCPPPPLMRRTRARAHAGARTPRIVSVFSANGPEGAGAVNLYWHALSTSPTDVAMLA